MFLTISGMEEKLKSYKNIEYHVAGDENWLS